MKRGQWVAAVALSVGLCSVDNEALRAAGHSGQTPHGCGCNQPSPCGCVPSSGGLLDRLDCFAKKMLKDSPKRPSVLSAFKISIAMDRQRCDEPSCGSEPSCGVEPSCGSEPTCGTENAEPNCGVEPKSHCSCPKCQGSDKSSSGNTIMEPTREAPPRSRQQAPAAKVKPETPPNLPGPMEHVPAPRVEDSLVDPFRDEQARSMPRGRVQPLSQRTSHSASRRILSDDRRNEASEEVGTATLSRTARPQSTAEQRSFNDRSSVVPAAAQVPARLTPVTAASTAIEPLKKVPAPSLHDADADFRSSRNPLRDRQ